MDMDSQAAVTTAPAVETTIPVVEAQENNEIAKDVDNLQKLEMQRVKPPTAEDDLLLAGLDELDNKEKADMEQRRAKFTPRDTADPQDQDVK